MAQVVAGALATRRLGCAEDCVGDRWSVGSALLRVRGPVDVFCVLPEDMCWLDLLDTDELRIPEDRSC